MQRKNGEALVADAFDMVGPFFAEMMSSRLKYLVEDIHEELNWQNMEGEVLVYYFLHKTFPNFKDNQAFKNLMAYSLDSEVYGMAQSLYP